VRLIAALLTLLFATACAPGGGPTRHSAQVSPASSSPIPVTSNSPEPQLPPYYIESLRRRSPAGGAIELGAMMFRGSGFTKREMSWPSAGRRMTGTISLPDGQGPFPVVVVVHGYIPASRYWVGQDSGIFGDPMATHGFISVAPNYPGYAGSDPGDPELPAIVAVTASVMDLVASLDSLPQADVARVGFIGHSNGGGVGLLELVSDSRIRAYALFAPVSRDMADNARMWWLGNGSAGPAGSPDQNATAYQHMSPRNYFAAGQAPALFLQGTADEEIPADWTNTTVAALQAAGVKTDVGWFPGGHHDLVGSQLAAADSQAEGWIRTALSG
jgi:dipeptidyl aminopeptidase/acylaminoacyl peptidase